MRSRVLIHVALSWAASSFAQNAPQLLSNFSLTEPSLLKVPAIIDNTTNLVTFPLTPWTDCREITPTFSVEPGYIVHPASGVSINLSRPVTYHVANTQGALAATWIFEAVQMNSPALPGLYADPNPVVFNNTFYIYTTTDGFPGWGGTTIYGWSSQDLVNWKRSPEPLVTLNGTAGNVPWANGNAWAPTIIERDGKYYLYFSGNNPAYDRKTIGVAVASYPLGPFTAESEAMILNNEAITTGQAIDPAAFRDPKTGVYYLYWGNGRPLVAELADNMISLKNNTIQNTTGLTNFTEASFVVYREPYYHYTYSFGDTGQANYSVYYATAPTATGPWTSRGVVLQQDPARGIFSTGSSGTVQVPGKDEWHMAYHRFRIPGGDGVHRETCVDRVTFDRETGLMMKVEPTLDGSRLQEKGKWE